MNEFKDSSYAGRDQKESRQEILRLLAEGAEALRAAVAGMSEQGARLRPPFAASPAPWSVLDCLEHVAAAESALLPLLRQAAPSGVSHQDPAREAKFQALALDRARRIEAPEMVQPTGDAPSLAAALER